MKRAIALILCFASVAALFAGCGSDSYTPTGDGLADYVQPTSDTGEVIQEQEFTLAYFKSEGFNPYICSNISNRLTFSLLYQGLFTMDRNYNVEPMLCKSFTVSADMTTYTFQLEEATFSDGTYLTAADVVASLKAAKSNNYYKGRFTHVSSIKEVGERTVQITLDCPYEHFESLLDIPIVKQGDVDSSRPKGTGPYSIVENASGLYLQKRSNWWCKASLPITNTSILLREEETPTSVRDAFEFEDVGISTADPGSASYAEYRCDYELWEAESGVFLYLAVNSKSSVFSNDAVRAALAYAIDRSAVLEQSYNGFGVTSTIPASPNSPYYNKSLAKQVYYDPTVLTNAVSENNKTGRTVTLLVNKRDSVRVLAARQIAAMIESCGLTVELLEYNTDEYLQTMKSGGYDLYLGQTKLSPNMDLSEFFAEDGSLRYGGLANAACYAMCLEALENNGNYYTLHQMVMYNGYLIPILFRSHAVYATRGLTDGLQPSRDNILWYSVGKTLEECRTLETGE